MKIPKKMSNNIPFMLAQADKSVQVRVDSEVGDLGLTRSQWLLLSMLYFVNGCNQTDLSVFMDIGKGALGKLAKKLDEKGWIERRADEADSRAVRLYISDEAMPMVKKLNELLFETTRLIELDLSKEEKDVLREVLRKIRLNSENTPSTKKWKLLKSQLMSEIARVEHDE